MIVSNIAVAPFLRHLFFIKGKSTSSTAAERNEMEEIAIREKEENDNFSEVCEIIDEICSEISGHLRGTDYDSWGSMYN